MELSYILNNGVDINREVELNNLINNITRTCMNSNGSTLVGHFSYFHYRMLGV